MCLVKAFRAFHKLQKSTKVIEGGRVAALLFSLEHPLPIYCSKKPANAKPCLCKKKKPTVLLMQHLRCSGVGHMEGSVDWPSLQPGYLFGRAKGGGAEGSDKDLSPWLQ